MGIIFHLIIDYKTSGSINKGGAIVVKRNETTIDRKLKMENGEFGGPIFS